MTFSLRPDGNDANTTQRILRLDVPFQNISDIDCGLTPYALLNQSGIKHPLIDGCKAAEMRLIAAGLTFPLGTGDRGRHFERTVARYVLRCRSAIDVVAQGQ